MTLNIQIIIIISNTVAHMTIKFDLHHVSQFLSRDRPPFFCEQ